MGKVKERKESVTKEFPGVPLDIFKATVQTCTDLLNTGKLLFFMGRASSIRIIVSNDVFWSAIGKQRESNGVDKEQAEEALGEVRRYARAYGKKPDKEFMISFLTRAVYDDEYDKFGDQEKQEFKKILEEKVNLVKDLVYGKDMRSRKSRIDSATIPCLEDVDYELIKERKNSSNGRIINEPFLRLRLRHTKEESFGFPFFPRFAMAWGEFGDEATESFELECDGSDIDLLLLRLKEAKDLLLSARESEDIRE